MPYSSLQERGVIAGMSSVGVPPEAIVQHPAVDRCLTTVKKWTSRWDEAGYEGLKTRPKPGRPKATTLEADAALVVAQEAEPKRKALHIARDLHFLGSNSTLYRR